MTAITTDPQVYERVTKLSHRTKGRIPQTGKPDELKTAVAEVFGVK